MSIMPRTRTSLMDLPGIVSATSTINKSKVIDGRCDRNILLMRFPFLRAATRLTLYPLPRNILLSRVLCSHFQVRSYSPQLPVIGGCARVASGLESTTTLVWPLTCQAKAVNV